MTKGGKKSKKSTFNNQYNPAKGHIGQKITGGIMKKFQPKPMAKRNAIRGK